MTYIRKTKDVYSIIWESEYGTEEIDSFESYIEAAKMIKEYKIAYHNNGCFSIKCKREKI